MDFFLIAQAAIWSYVFKHSLTLSRYDEVWSVVYITSRYAVKPPCLHPPVQRRMLRSILFRTPPCKLQLRATVMRCG